MPLISTVIFGPLAVMSMVFHLPPVMTTLSGLATSTMRAGAVGLIGTLVEDVHLVGVHRVDRLRIRRSG